uniref:Uncharacterized protein n=1 Tax=Cacopsylla melanoneura TaxID=428564 RepID=A0A8D8XVL8_9HEMI
MACMALLLLDGFTGRTGLDGDGSSGTILNPPSWEVLFAFPPGFSGTTLNIGIFCWLSALSILLVISIAFGPGGLVPKFFNFFTGFWGSIANLLLSIALSKSDSNIVICLSKRSVLVFSSPSSVSIIELSFSIISVVSSPLFRTS